jgi:hypothetical protein
MVEESGRIVLDANAEITSGTFTFEKWVKSASQLVDLALNTGLGLIPAMMPFTCLPAATEHYGLSDWIEVDVSNDCDRALSVSQAFVKIGEPACVIPNEFVAFSLANLPRGESTFRVQVTWPDLRTGTYRGQIRLTRVGVANAHSDEVTRTIDL